MKLACLLTLLLALPGEIRLGASADGVTMGDLLRDVCRRTGESISMDPDDPVLRERLAFSTSSLGQVPPDRMLAWLQSLLSFHRRMLVPTLGHHQWMLLDLSSEQITNRPIFVPEAEVPNWADQDGVYVVTVIPARRVPRLSEAREALRALATPGVGSVNVAASRDAFIVGDLAPVVATMLRVVRDLEVAAPDLVEVAPPEGGWGIETLIGEVSAATGEVIGYDPVSPQIARGWLRMVGGPRRIPRSRLFDFYRSLLRTRRVVLVPQGPDGSGSWIALDVNSPLVTHRPVYVPPEELPLWAGRDGAYVVTVLPLGDLQDTAGVRKCMAWIATRTIGRVNDVPGARCLVIGESAPMVAVMASLVATMRGEAPPSAFPAEVSLGGATVRMAPREGGWEVEELLEEVARRTGAAFIYDPQSPRIARRKIEWSGPREVPEGRLLEWFASLFSFHRLVLVPVAEPEDRVFQVLDINAPQCTNRPIFVPPGEVEAWADRDGALIVTAIPVPHIEDTGRVQGALEQMATRTIGRVADDPGDRWFVIEDFAPRAARICRILRELDAAAAR